MSGFFRVTDVPIRRVVQYARVSHSGEGVAYIEDESVLGNPVNEMPYADKTGLAVTSVYFGMLYEVPYLPDAGDVYFAEQPAIKDDVITATVKAGTAPYRYQWFKDGRQVVNVPDSGSTLVVTEPGSYFCQVEDSEGVIVVSKAVELE